MKKLLVFDTETDKLADFKLPPTSPAQPHIVQLAAVLFDAEQQRTVSTLSALIKPAGWVIPASVEAIHKISTGQATAFGQPLGAVMPYFVELVRSADVICAHNAPFDLLVIQAECARLGWDTSWLTSKKVFDTMLACIDVVRIPRRGGGFKWPTLSECWKHFFGGELQGAHDALTDVNACADIYFRLHATVCSTCQGKGWLPSCHCNTPGPTCTCPDVVCPVCNAAGREGVPF